MKQSISYQINVRDNDDPKKVVGKLTFVSFSSRDDWQGLINIEIEGKRYTVAARDVIIGADFVADKFGAFLTYVQNMKPIEVGPIEIKSISQHQEETPKP